MTFREFKKWCNQRSCDGYWSLSAAKICISIIDDIRKDPFWKRRKHWNEISTHVENEIVNPINKLIRDMNEEDNRPQCCIDHNIYNATSCHDCIVHGYKQKGYQ